MNQVQWKQPPEAEDSYEPKLTLEEIANQLRARPGEWALVRSYPEHRWTSARTMAHDIMIGRSKHFRPLESFEAKTAKEDGTDDNGNPVREVNVYARYVGDAA